MAGKSKSEIVNMVVGKKVWQVSRKFAYATLELAKDKYTKENVNAIVGVEKDGMVSLLNDTFNNTDAFVKAVANWERGGYKCHYTTKKG